MKGEFEVVVVGSAHEANKNCGSHCQPNDLSSHICQLLQTVNSFQTNSALFARCDSTLFKEPRSNLITFDKVHLL